MEKRGIGYVMFLAGALIIILWGTLGITGNVISENAVSAKVMDLIGLTVILVSISFMVSKERKARS